MGNEPETAARTCLLATGLARGVGLTEEVVADVFYTALLLHLGCTVSAHEAAAAGRPGSRHGWAPWVQEVPGGHVPMFTHPQELVASIRPLLQRGA